MTIICFLKTFYRTAINWRGLINFGAYTSGHDYLEQEDGNLICEVCGNKTK